MGTRILRTLAAVLAALLIAPAASATPAPVEARGQVTQVLDLRYAAHDDFDRVVIDLRGPMPIHRTGYAREFAYEGSGKPVPIRGRSGLWLSLVASGHTQSGTNLYTGPRIARPRFETLKALAITGDWEGQVTFAFALRHRADYRIHHLGNPSRLVIDFRHR